VNWTLTRRLPDGTREEIEPEKLWAEHDALAARDRELAEARVQAGDWCDAEALQRVRAETAERALAEMKKRAEDADHEVGYKMAELAEARGLLEHIARCRDEHHAHDAGWLERCFPLAARPAPAEGPCTFCRFEGNVLVACPAHARADPRPAPPCDCGFPWGGGLTAPKRHANDCATRAAPPAPEDK